MQKCTVDDTHLGHFFACLNVVITMRSHMYFQPILSSQRNNYDVGKVCDVGRRARILYFHWCANFGLPINIPWCTTALHSCCPLVMYTQLLYHISSSFLSLERCIFWCTNAEFTAMVWLEFRPIFQPYMVWVVIKCGWLTAQKPLPTAHFTAQMSAMH